MPATTDKLALPYPLPDDTVDVPRDVKALADAIDPLGVVPVGAIHMWPVAAAPAGYLLMQGQQVPAATYPGLAALFGSAGGNVTIPDWRDYFPIGAGENVVGATGGAKTVALTVAQMPSHNHGGLTGNSDRGLGHTHPSPNASTPFAVTTNSPQGGGGSSFAAINGAVNDTGYGAAPDHLHGITGQGGNAAHENRPPFRAVNFIIRAG